MSSYRQIFKSTAIVGGAQVLKLFIGLIQNKALALLLGPSGIGLANMYQNAANLIGSFTGFGISNSGVRQIAEAAATNDEARVAITIKTLRIASWIAGLLGMLIVLALCKPLAQWTLESSEFAGGVALMSIAVLFASISTGQAALLQGLRRLKDLAACQVISAIFGAIASISLIYFLRDKGIAWYLVAASVFGVLPSWWYARKVRLSQKVFPAREIVAQARQMFGLGLGFMISSSLANGLVPILTQCLILHEFSKAGYGLYAAASRLSNYYVGIVLQAMGADFYPRLTGVAGNHATVNRLVNEQTEIGVLFSLPGALATLALAPGLMHLLNSSAFVAGGELFRWLTVGVVFRMMCFPMGYILPAKGMTNAFILAEVGFSAAQLGLLYPCMKIWGLEGAGIALMMANILLTIGLLWVSRRITGFRWSRQSLLLIVSAGAAMALTQASVRFLPPLPGTIVALAITGVVSVGCLVFLQRVLNVNIRDLGPWKRMAQAFRSKAE